VDREGGRRGVVVPEHTHQKDEKHATQTASAQSTDDEAYEASYKQADDVVPDESNKSNNP
jgi:hypothetical protein